MVVGMTGDCRSREAVRFVSWRERDTHTHIYIYTQGNRERYTDRKIRWSARCEMANLSMASPENMVERVRVLIGVEGERERD